MSYWQIGAVINGKYRIIEEIGNGGMGVVYKAEHVVFRELRALKVMHPHLAADEKFRRGRFGNRPSFRVEHIGFRCAGEFR